MREPWTDFQIARIKRLCKEGYSYSEAGEMMGRTRNSIGGKAQSLGLKFKGANRGKNTRSTRSAIAAGLMKFREKKR
jgi:hypothetical protein